MKKQKKQQEYHELDEFEDYCNLWTIFSGGSGRAIVFLRKLVDCIQSDNYSNPGNELPSLLLTGQGKDLIARAFVNSLKIEDIRECPGLYLDNGIGSSQFFEDSLINTAHLITDVELLTKTGESVIWRYLKQGKCRYYNFMSKNFDKIIHCNGLIFLTAKDIKTVSESIVKAVTHVITLEPYTIEQLLLVAHQYLKFCGIDYDGEKVLQEIVGPNSFGIRVVINTLKTCIVLLKAEMADCLTVEIVRKAKRLIALPPPPDPDDDIPF